MLRHALRRNRAASGLYHGIKGGQRFKTTGYPRPQRDRENLTERKPQTRRPNPQRGVRPDFLQSLRVVRTPSPKEGAVVKPRPTPKTTPNDSKTSSKLMTLLRNGPRPDQTNVGVPSATQSNLQQKSQNNKNPAQGSHDLVGFFQKRLEEAKANNLKNNPDNQQQPEGYRPSGRIAGQPRGYQRPQSSPRPPPQQQRYPSQGLSAAMRDVRLAQTTIDTAVPSGTSQEELSTVKKVLDQSMNPSSTPTTAAAPKREETMSPIRRYVTELQRKNHLKREEQMRKRGLDDMEVPSWRKTASMKAQQQQQQYHRPMYNPQQQQYQQQQYQQQQKQEDSIYASVSVQLDQDAMAVAPSREPDSKTDKEEEVQETKRVKRAPKENVVLLPQEDVTIPELSRLFRKKISEITTCLEDMGESPAQDDNYTIDVDMAEMVALELDIKFKRQKRRAKLTNDHEQLMNRRKVAEEGEQEVETAEGATATTTYQDLAPRPPVVCIMGHVDHGKTTLMDTLRRRSQGGGGKQKKSKKGKKDKKKGGKKAAGGDVAGTEAGGITQIISAFQVPLMGDQRDAITFLDTPGHAAFSAMRQSGSHAADVIVLVIAADDGVSPQTIEILNFYKSIVKEAEGGITMVVAMNKIDKPGINVDEARRRIENQLLEHDIVPEGISTDSEYGAPVQLIPISAKTGEGVDDLIEGLVLQSEVMDLRADDTARAEGIVMDARVEQGLGVVVDCIVRWGTIEKGDVVVSDTSSGRVRLLKDVNDKQLKKGLPSQPVRIVGFKEAPKAGDPIVCVASEQVADELVERRRAIQDRDKAKDVPNDPNSPFSQVIISGPEAKTSAGTERRLERYELSMEDTGPIRIPIVVKAKADGSVAAVRDSLKALAEESSFDIDVDPIAEGVGVLTLSEVEMAKASDAVVFCFDIKNQDKVVVAEAESAGVTIHEFDIIYSLLDHAKEVFTTYLPPTPFEQVYGRAKVQAVFSINNDKDKVAGLRVLEGNMHKSFADSDKRVPVNFRVIRDGEVITPEGEETRATSLKKFKEDVETVRHGEECGLSLSRVDFQEGDEIECYSIEMKKVFSK